MKAVIYARYSDDNQREESIEGQLRECYEYAKRHGIEVIRESSSTDCNIPLSLGIPALCIGVYMGAGWHTRNE